MAFQRLPNEEGTVATLDVLYNRHMRCETCQRDAPADAGFCPYCGKALHVSTATGSFDYAAFISYRHLPRDQEVAKRVQRAIETYRLPRDIAGREDARALGKCFRDEDELAAAHSLPDRILDALKRSSSLIVVCTPNTPDSVWVQREIEAFVDMHGRERVFAVLADGSSTESIPALLQSNPGGGNAPDHSSPLAADMRPEAAKKQREETLRLIAGIAGCGYDDLKQRDRIRRRKRTIVAAVAAAVVVVALVGTIAFAMNAHRHALVAESNRLIGESSQLFAQGDRYGAIEKALEALTASDASNDQLLVENARLALVDALELEIDEELCWRPSYSIELDNDAVSLATEPDHDWFAVLDSSINVSTYEYSTGKKLASFSPMDLALDESFIDIDSDYRVWKVLPANDHVIIGECGGSGVIAVFNAKTGQCEWSYSSFPIRGLTTSYDKEVFDIFALGDEVIFGLALNLNKSTFSEKDYENSENLQSRMYFVPTIADDNGLMYIGVGNRIVGFNFSQEDAPMAMSDVNELEYYSMCQAQNLVIASSVSQLNTEAKSWDDYERTYRFECFDQDLNTLWSHEGTWMPRLEGEGSNRRAVTGEPRVHGTANLDKTYAICTVGDTLLLFDSSTGELSYTEQFGSTIMSAGTDGVDENDNEILRKSNYAGDMIVIACSDGSVSFRFPFMDRAESANQLNFSFPGDILNPFAEWTSAESLSAVAISKEQPNRIYGLHLDTRGPLGNYEDAPRALKGLLSVEVRYIDMKTLEKFYPSPSSYSLQELIDLAHTTLSEGGRE